MELHPLHHRDTKCRGELIRRQLLHQLRESGVMSANTRWTNSVAILTGDYLFAKVSDLLADMGAEAVRLQQRTKQ